jgi:hypothetical protein
MTKFLIGDKVLFSRAVVKRLNYDKAIGDARGIVVNVSGPVISVDFTGTWVQHENGGTVRHVPAANLVKTLSA